jgi:DNA polymerase elongation subunit (family B)
MTVWIITENGERVKLVDTFQPKIYVSGKIPDLSKLTDQLATSKSVARWRYVQKYANFMENKRSRVLEITTTDCRRIPYFARKLLRLGGYEEFRLHNVDLPDAQAYFYDRDIFPLAFVRVTVQGDRLSYWMLDTVESVDYEIPPLRSMSLHLKITTDHPVPGFDDPISSIVIECNGENIVIDHGGEADRILRMVEVIKEKDPDIIATRGGDSFLFPYLAHRALLNGVLSKLVLGREDVPLRAKKR